MIYDMIYDVILYYIILYYIILYYIILYVNVENSGSLEEGVPHDMPLQAQG
jgi:hypothetical protein